MEKENNHYYIEPLISVYKIVQIIRDVVYHKREPYYNRTQKEISDDIYPYINEELLYNELETLPLNYTKSLIKYITTTYQDKFFHHTDLEIAYKALIDGKRYFYGCPFDLYKITYNTRLKIFIEQNIDAQEIDFIDYELNKGILEFEMYDKHIITFYYLNEYTLRRRFEFLQDKAKSINYSIEILGKEKYRFIREQEQVAFIESPIIDLSDTIPKDKIRYLHELGIIDYLRGIEPFSTSTNSLATVISAFTGIKSKTVQSYINPMINDDAGQNNNPLNNINKMKKVRNKLIEIGFKQFK